MVRDGDQEKRERVRVRKQGWGEVDSDIIKPLRTVKSHCRFSGCI